EINVQTAGGPIPYDWPAGVNLSFNGSNQALLQATSASWGNAYPTTATNCPTGISIDPMKISVTPVVSGIPSTTVHFGTGHPGNTFVAELDNGGLAIPNGTVKARFRIANWGSMIGVGGDWNDIVPTPPGGTPLTKTNVASEIAFPCVNP